MQRGDKLSELYFEMSSVIVIGVAFPIGNALLLKLGAKNGNKRTVKLHCRSSLANGLRSSPSSSAVAAAAQEEVKQKVQKQAALVKRRVRERGYYYNGMMMSSWDPNEAYDRCVEMATKDASSFLLTTSLDSPSTSALSFLIQIVSSILWKPDRNKAFAALAVWCRRTDELVDGINGWSTTPEVLDKWEQRLFDLFHGRPSDLYDAALFHTITNYPIDIQVHQLIDELGGEMLFKDFIEGMRMDLKKSRYENFDELYLYSYHVAGTVALMGVQLMGTSPDSKASPESVYHSALSFAIATQLTDILRDIGEEMGRIYLPQDELAQAGLSDDDIYRGEVTDEWRNFMRGQIKRARMYSDEGEKLIAELNSDDRWLIWLVTLLNRQILDNIEADDFSFTKKASVGIAKQLVTVVAAHGISLGGGGSSNFVELREKKVDMGVIGAIARHLDAIIGYASMRAIESPSTLDDQQWLTYWVLYSLITLFELSFGKVLQWFPFWPYMKLVFCMWLVLPIFNGAAYIYANFVRKYIKVGGHVSSSIPEGQRKALQMLSLDARKPVERFIENYGPDAFDRVIKAAEKEAKKSKEIK
ncbi:unnamed protein product [Camellia sinensis]